MGDNHLNSRFSRGQSYRFLHCARHCARFKVPSAPVNNHTMKLVSSAKPRFAFGFWLCLAIVALASTGCRVEYYPTRVLSLEETSSIRLQEILNAWRSRHGVVGVAIAVDGPGIGAIGAASGISNKEAGAAMTPHDRFAVAGLTKTFTAALVLQLAGEGSLGLDDRLDRWFPEFRNSQSITVRQLLDHTSGVAEYLGPVFFSSMVLRIDSNRLYESREMIGFAATEPPSGSPGEGWSYSNTNYVMLGRIVEDVTGNPLEDELRSRFLQPYNLPNTFLMGVETVPCVVHGYTSEYAQVFGETGGEFVLDQGVTTLVASSLWAAGGLASTAGDMTRWAKALYGGQVLSQSFLEQMVAPSPLTVGFSQGGGLETGAGLGAFLYSTSIGPATGHWGESPGFSALMLYVPSHGIAITVLTNDDRAPATRLNNPEPQSQTGQDLGLLVDEVLLAVLKQIEDS